MRYMLAICVLSLTTLTASAGPLRQWIHDHRPGVLIPKRDVVIETAHSSNKHRCSTTLSLSTCIQYNPLVVRHALTDRVRSSANRTGSPLAGPQG